MVERYELFSGAISVISTCIQKIETEQMTRYGLKGSCAQYLAVMLRNEEGVTVSKLSEICMKDKAAVSRAISELEEKGLVRRKSVGNNIYRAAIVLTENGKQVAQYVEKQASTAVELAGNGFSAEDRKVFYRVLDLIADNLRALCKEGLPKSE